MVARPAGVALRESLARNIALTTGMCDLLRNRWLSVELKPEVA
jgi:hypothetical protein